MGQYKIKRTKKWAYEFQYQDRRYKQEGYMDRASALSAENARRRELKAEQRRIPIGSWVEVVTRYLNHCQLYMQKNTWRQKSHVYRTFIQSLGPRVNPPFISITRQMIMNYLTALHRETTSKTANRHLRDLKALFNWAAVEISEIPNPCAKIQKFPEDPYHPYVPPAQDMAKAKLAATRDELDFIETLYHAIARKSEAVRLTWEDVNFGQRWVRLWTRKRRGGELESQIKPMNDTLYDILHRRWERRDKTDYRVFQLTDKELRVMMENICERAEITPRFGFHSIRHFVLSLINDSGKANVKQIQELAGHKRQATTEIYLHSMGQATRDAVTILDQNLDGFLKSPTLESHAKLKNP
jgi:site-specific recombinase XerD